MYLKTHKLDLWLWPEICVWACSRKEPIDWNSKQSATEWLWIKFILKLIFSNLVILFYSKKLIRKTDEIHACLPADAYTVLWLKLWTTNNCAVRSSEAVTTWHVSWLFQQIENSWTAETLYGTILCRKEMDIGVHWSVLFIDLYLFLFLLGLLIGHLGCLNVEPWHYKSITHFVSLNEAGMTIMTIMTIILSVKCLELLNDLL